MKEIVEYLQTVVETEFKVPPEHIYRLSPVNLFYLYIAIYKKYNVQIGAEDINGGCFYSIEDLASVIFREVSEIK